MSESDILENFSIDELDIESSKENNNKNINRNINNQQENKSEIIKDEIYSDNNSNIIVKDNFKEMDNLNDKMLKLNNNNIKNSNKIEDNHIYYMEDENKKKKIDIDNKTNTNEINEYEDDFNMDILTEEDKNDKKDKINKSKNDSPILLKEKMKM